DAAASRVARAGEAEDDLAHVGELLRDAAGERRADVTVVEVHPRYFHTRLRRRDVCLARGQRRFRASQPRRRRVEGRGRGDALALQDLLAVVLPLRVLQVDLGALLARLRRLEVRVSLGELGA